MDNTGNGEQFPVMEEVFKEAKRVFRPGGILFIIECLPSTQRYSVWYNQLNQAVTERWCKLFPTVKQYEAMFNKRCFKIVSKLTILDVDFQKTLC